MVLPCQWITNQRILALKFFTGYVHRSTLPQSRIRSTAPSEREPGMGCAIQPGARRLRRCGRFSSPLRKLCNFLPVTNIGGHSLSQPFGLTAPSEREPGMGCAIQPGGRGLRRCGRFSSPLRKALSIHRSARGKAGSVRMHRPRWVCQGGMKLLWVTWPKRQSGSGFRR